MVFASHTVLSVKVSFKSKFDSTAVAAILSVNLPADALITQSLSGIAVGSIAVAILFASKYHNLYTSGGATPLSWREVSLVL